MKKLIFLLATAVVAISVSACTTAERKTEQEGVKLTIPTTDQKDSPVKDNEPDSTIDQNKKEITKKTMDNEVKSPENQADLTKDYSGAVIKTNLGDIKVKLYNTDSPITVNNFLHLAQVGFYNNTKFHRVIKDFMIQGGDPNSKTDNVATYGTGGSDYRFNDEFNSHKLVAGSLAMANAGPNTNGSQFFIVTAESTPWLDGKHTNFGEVVEGMDVVKKIEAVETATADRPVEPVIVNSVELVK